jgi:hypothetical protein
MLSGTMHGYVTLYFIIAISESSNVAPAHMWKYNKILTIHRCNSNFLLSSCADAQLLPYKIGFEINLLIILK